MSIKKALYTVIDDMIYQVDGKYAPVAIDQTAKTTDYLGYQPNLFGMRIGAICGETTFTYASSNDIENETLSGVGTWRQDFSNTQRIMSEIKAMLM